jgi:hypothetical protein
MGTVGANHAQVCTMRAEAQARSGRLLQGVSTELSDFFAGASCARCDLDLSFDGYCPNDRCPFADTYQDELTNSWVPPDDDERLYIETVVRPRLRDR